MISIAGSVNANAITMTTTVNLKGFDMGKTYRSVTAMLKDMNLKKTLEAAMKLINRDRAIVLAFRNGASFERLKNKYSVPMIVVESAIRHELQIAHLKAKSKEKGK